MGITRRDFVALTIAGAAASKTTFAQDTRVPSTQENQSGVIDAGPLDDYAHDGVFDMFTKRGFVLVRKDKQLFALSSICPHRGCKVVAQPDGTLVCPCHHSHFTADGKVTKGPATKDLPRLAVATDDQGRVIVDPAQIFEAGRFPDPPAEPR